MLIRRQAIASCTAAFAALTFADVYAQPSESGNAAINQAISNAVQEGTNPYHPMSPQSAGQTSQEEVCRELASQIATAPKREYKTTGGTIDTAQGRSIPELERDTPRKDLQKLYQEKCTQ